MVSTNHAQDRSPEGDGRYQILKVLPSPAEIKELCNKIGIPTEELEARWAQHAIVYEKKFGLPAGDGLLAWQHASLDGANREGAYKLVQTIAEALKENPECCIYDVIDESPKDQHQSVGLVHIESVLSSETISNVQKTHLFQYVLTPRLASVRSSHEGEGLTIRDAIMQGLGYVAQAALTIQNIDAGKASLPPYVRQIVALQAEELLEAIYNQVTFFSTYAGVSGGGFEDLKKELEIVEDFLISMGRSEPAHGELCSQLIPEWKRIQDRESGYRFFQRSHDLLPVEVEEYQIDGRLLAEEAQSAAKALVLELRLTRALLPMGEKPAWNNAISEITNQLENNGVVQLHRSCWTLLNSDRGKDFLDQMLDSQRQTPHVFIDVNAVPSSIAFSDEMAVNAITDYLRGDSRDRIFDDLNASKKDRESFKPLVDLIDYLKDKWPGVKVQVCSAAEFEPWDEPVLWLDGTPLGGYDHLKEAKILHCDISLLNTKDQDIDRAELLNDITGQANDPMRALRSLQKMFQLAVIPTILQHHNAGLCGSVGFYVGELEAMALSSGLFQYPFGETHYVDKYSLRPGIFTSRPDTLRICLTDDPQTDDDTIDPQTEQNDLSDSPHSENHAGSGKRRR